MRPWFRWSVALITIVTAVVAAWAIHRSFEPPVRRAPAPAAEPALDDAMVERALDLADPWRSEKTRWVDEIPDLELAALGERRALFLRVANGRLCDCGCGYTLASCRRWDATCPVSGPRARALFDSVKAGLVPATAGLREPPQAHE